MSDLSAKGLDSLEAELSKMETDQKIKLLGVLTRWEAQFKDKDKNGLTNIAEAIIEMEKNGRIEPEDIEVENVVDYK